MTAPITTDEHATSPPDWVATVLERRARYITILLAAAVVLTLGRVLHLTWTNFAVLVALYASAELAPRLSRRMRDDPHGVQRLEWFFHVEVLLLVIASWGMSATRWLGPAALLVELVLANMAMPRGPAFRVTGTVIAGYLVLVWGEAFGLIPSMVAFGTASYQGNVAVAVAATLAGTIILVFTADALQRTSQLIRAREARREAGERLQTLGRFGTAIAHDASNVLTVIRLNVEELETLLPEGHDGRPAVAALASAAEYGRALARQLLTYGRRDAGPPVRLAVGEVVRSLEPFVTRLLGHHVTLRLRVPTPSPVVIGDATQLEQVVVNLAVNARDAMAKRGALDIGVDQLLADGPPSLPLLADGKRADYATGSAPGEGRWCRISVIDQGSGIPADVLPHVLEPFYTTKAADKGNGIGLATVQDVITNAAGHIRIATGEGRGTRVDVYWPSAPVEGA